MADEGLEANGKANIGAATCIGTGLVNGGRIQDGNVLWFNVVNWSKRVEARRGQNAFDLGSLQTDGHSLQVPSLSVC